MQTWAWVILLSILFVGFFVIGMSLTLMIKGHNIDSEISTNKNMRERGITCAIQDTSAEQGDCDKLCGDKSCFDCDKNSSATRVVK